MNRYGGREGKVGGRAEKIERERRRGRGIFSGDLIIRTFEDLPGAAIFISQCVPRRKLNSERDIEGIVRPVARHLPASLSALLPFPSPPLPGPLHPTSLVSSTPCRRYIQLNVAVLRANFTLNC